MNERIKLPVQEWLGYDPEKGDIHGYTFEQMREFSELIIRVCNHYLWTNEVEWNYNKEERMFEHFGVE